MGKRSGLSSGSRRPSKHINFASGLTHGLTHGRLYDLLLRANKQEEDEEKEEENAEKDSDAGLGDEGFRMRKRGSGGVRGAGAAGGARGAIGDGQKKHEMEALLRTLTALSTI